MRSCARRAGISRFLPAHEVIRLSGKGRSSTARFGSDLLHGGPTWRAAGSSRSPPSREQARRILRIAPSSSHEYRRRKADPDLQSTRAKQDERLSKEIVRVHARHFGVYGAKKVLRFAQSLRDEFNREGFKVGRDRFARLHGMTGGPIRR